MHTENAGPAESHVLEVAFAEFVRRAAALLPRAEPPDAQFTNFVRNATPFVIDHVKAQLDRRHTRIEALVETLVQHDLLAVAGFAGREVAYTELLRWMLSPETHPASALQRQRAFLRELEDLGCQTDPDRLQSAVEPETNFCIPGYGIADLVLRSRDVVVVVESKTGTEEHDTPAGTAQTIAYPAGLRRLLELGADVRLAVVLLAPELRVPENRDAVAMTFVAAAGVFAEELPSLGLDDETRWAFRFVLSHLVEHASPAHARHMRSALMAAARYLDAHEAAERHAIVIGHLDSLVALVGALEER